MNYPAQIYKCIEIMNSTKDEEELDQQYEHAVELLSAFCKERADNLMEYERILGKRNYDLQPLCER